MEVKKQPQMSGSEPGMMSGRESYGVTLQKNQVSPQPPANMRLAFSPDGTAVYKPITGSPPPYPSGGTPPGSGGGGDGSGAATTVQQSANTNMAEPMKRKRGRPRKYGPDGTMALALAPAPVLPAVAQSAGSEAISSGGFPSATSPSSPKKARGRPPGSGKKQQMAALDVGSQSRQLVADNKIEKGKRKRVHSSVGPLLKKISNLGSAGIGFTPHVITVKAGEDVSSKIMAFSQHGPRAVCILSANGAISNVTLRQAATSGGTVTYEGRFEILSLSGSFLLSESGGQRSRTGGLSVSLAGPDGRVLGGGVAGLLTAASPVQVVVGSFIADGHKESKPLSSPDPSVLPKLAPGVGTGTGSPPSRGTLSESSGGPGSPLNQSTGACNNNTQQRMANISWK